MWSKLVLDFSTFGSLDNLFSMFFLIEAVFILKLNILGLFELYVTFQALSFFSSIFQFLLQPFPFLQDIIKLWLNFVNLNLGLYVDAFYLVFVLHLESLALCLHFSLSFPQRLLGDFFGEFHSLVLVIEHICIFFEFVLIGLVCVLQFH
jgi:hypothetical protein